MTLTCGQIRELSGFKPFEFWLILTWLVEVLIVDVCYPLSTELTNARCPLCAGRSLVIFNSYFSSTRRTFNRLYYYFINVRIWRFVTLIWFEARFFFIICFATTLAATFLHLLSRDYHFFYCRCNNPLIQ